MKHRNGHLEDIDIGNCAIQFALGLLSDVRKVCVQELIVRLSNRTSARQNAFVSKDSVKHFRLCIQVLDDVGVGAE